MNEKTPASQSKNTVESPAPEGDKEGKVRPVEFWRGIYETVKTDKFAGALMLTATLLAVILANTGASNWYFAVRDFHFGFPSLGLDLSVGEWAADGLLAIFFFVVGLELKEEFTVGSLRDPRKAILPIAATFGGVIAPALVYLAINGSFSSGHMEGWAVPTATDIAFVVAVLAVVGKHLPPEVRIFLLTLAVVDDLIAIIIIATVFSTNISLLWLFLALVPLAVFAFAVQKGIRSWWILVPLGILTWGFLHASGIHATVAGVALGFTVPATATLKTRVPVQDTPGGPVEYDSMAAYFADRWGVFATLVAVPVFAFFSAGVSVGGWDGLTSVLAEPVTLGVLFGLLLGKPLGIVGASFIVSRFPGIKIAPLSWLDLFGIGFVAGIGFTVALLVGELAFGFDSPFGADAKVGVLVGSLVSAIIGATWLSIRSNHYKKLELAAAAK